MGMYDMIVIGCPNCGEPYLAESKGGECLLKTYTLSNVPQDVLGDVNRHAPFTCSLCGAKFGVKLIPHVIKLF